MNLTAQLAQVEINKEAIAKLTEDEIKFLNKLVLEVKKTEPTFEIYDFKHNDTLPVSHDLFHLYIGMTLDTKAYLNAGMAIVAFNNNSGDWLINLVDPMGKEK